MLFQNTRKSQRKLKEVRLNILIDGWDVVKEVSQISFIYTFNYLFNIYWAPTLCWCRLSTIDNIVNHTYTYTYTLERTKSSTDLPTILGTPVILHSHVTNDIHLDEVHL